MLSVTLKRKQASISLKGKGLSKFNHCLEKGTYLCTCKSLEKGIVQSFGAFPLKRKFGIYIGKRRLVEKRFFGCWGVWVYFLSKKQHSSMQFGFQSVHVSAALATNQHVHT